MCFFFFINDLISIWEFLKTIFGEGNGTPLQYSCLETPMDKGAWKAAVHGVAEGRTQLSMHAHRHVCVCLNTHTHTHTHTHIYI